MNVSLVHLPARWMVKVSCPVMNNDMAPPDRKECDPTFDFLNPFVFVLVADKAFLTASTISLLRTYLQASVGDSR